MSSKYSTSLVFSENINMCFIFIDRIPSDIQLPVQSTFSLTSKTEWRKTLNETVRQQQQPKEDEKRKRFRKFLFSFSRNDEFQSDENFCLHRTMPTIAPVPATSTLTTAPAAAAIHLSLRRWWWWQRRREQRRWQRSGRSKQNKLQTQNYIYAFEFCLHSRRAHIHVPYDIRRVYVCIRSGRNRYLFQRCCWLTK